MPKFDVLSAFLSSDTLKPMLSVDLQLAAIILSGSLRAKNSERLICLSMGIVCRIKAECFYKPF